MLGDNAVCSLEKNVMVSDGLDAGGGIVHGDLCVPIGKNYVN